MTINTADQMKKCTTNTLPVSKKAYESFVDRINCIVKTASQRQMMLDALDRYLHDDTANYNSDLDESCRMAFEFLRADIDAAIRRSAIARSRATRRREKEDKVFAAMATALASLGHKPASGTMNDIPAISETEDEQRPSVQPLHIPRYMRRAQERSSRTKTKWRKIG